MHLDYLQYRSKDRTPSWKRSNLFVSRLEEVCNRAHKIISADIKRKNLKMSDDSTVHSESSRQDNNGISRSDSSKNSSMTDKTSSHASEAHSELAQHETKLVKRSKALVFFVLLAAAAGCGVGKLLLRMELKDNFALVF
jgi:hypothetical protein